MNCKHVYWKYWLPLVDMWLYISLYVPALGILLILKKRIDSNRIKLLFANFLTNQLINLEHNVHFIGDDPLSFYFVRN